LIVIGSPRYNLYARYIQEYFDIKLEYIFDSYDTDPARKILKIFDQYNVEHSASVDLYKTNFSESIDYGIVVLAKLKNDKKIIWISGIHGPGSIGVYKYLTEHTNFILEFYPTKEDSCSALLLRICYDRNKTEGLNMINGVELIGESQISNRRKIDNIPRVLICDLGNVIMFSDRYRTYRSLAHVLKISYIQVAEMIENTDVRQRYEDGLLSDSSFYKELLNLFGIKEEILPFEVFSEFWGDIFWPNKNMLYALNELKKQVKLVLLSNTNNLHFSYIEEHYSDVVKIFEDRLILSYKERISKPNQEIFHRTLRYFRDQDVSYNDCVYIDDKIEYVAVAKKIGMKGFVFYNYPQVIYSLRKLGLYVP
jgi:FMN phosphatase YigB (HAD superfamily)